MSVNIRVSCEYVAFSYNDIVIPEIESWDELGGWYVKWGVFHYWLKDDAEGKNEVRTIYLQADYDIDSKRPRQAEVALCDEEWEELDTATLSVKNW